jgi:hypothetical protein
VSNTGDSLTDEFHDYIGQFFERLNPILEDAEREGITGIVILGAYDRPTKTPHNQWSIVGDPVRVDGQIWDYTQGRSFTLTKAFVEAEEDNGDE